MASAGDVNGDGYDDVLVAAPYYDDPETDEGKVFLYLGSSAGPGETSSWTAEPDQAYADFGLSVAGAGDVNRDGFDDLVIGAPYYDHGEAEEGRAFLYLGSPDGPSPTPDGTAESDQAIAGFGLSVAGAGDVDGDGYDDVIVGAPAFDDGEVEEGRAFLFRGSPTGPSPTPDWTAESDQVFAGFGYSVAGAGDVNADGYQDVVIGADLYDHGQLDEGRAFVYLGSPSGLSSTPVWTAESNQNFSSFGFAVGTAGDANGDGYDDVLVGAPLFVGEPPSGGAAFLYPGSPTGPSTTASWSVEPDQDEADLGLAVAGAGDVDGDGFDDVVVGAPFYNFLVLDEGRALLFGGSADGPVTRASDSTAGNQPAANLGFAVSSAGDVNGDGFDDVVVGMPGFGPGLRGGALVFRGRPGA